MAMSSSSSAQAFCNQEKNPQLHTCDRGASHRCERFVSDPELSTTGALVRVFFFFLLLLLLLLFLGFLSSFMVPPVSKKIKVYKQDQECV